MDRIAIAIAETASAAAVLNALVVLELDKRGLLSKGDFSETLKKQVQALEDNPPAFADGSARTDLKILRSVVGYLDGPPPKGWTPVVIKGGRD